MRPNGRRRTVGPGHSTKVHEGGLTQFTVGWLGQHDAECRLPRRRLAAARPCKTPRPSGGVDHGTGTNRGAVRELETVPVRVGDPSGGNSFDPADAMRSARPEGIAKSFVVERDVAPRETVRPCTVGPHLGARGRQHVVDVDQSTGIGAGKVIGPSAVSGSPVCVVADQERIEALLDARLRQCTARRAVTDDCDVDLRCRR